MPTTPQLLHADRSAQAKIDQNIDLPVLIALLYRTVLFAVCQAVIAAALALGGDPTPWETSTGWWPLSAAVTSGIGLWLLRLLLRRENRRLRDLYLPPRETWARDLGMALAVLALAGPVSLAPMTLLGTWLFGDPAIPQQLLLRPLPLWALAVILPAFPLLIALSELPTYFGYALPRLLARGWRPLPAILVPALLLAAQHCALPLRFEPAFLAWRFGMFLPFALLLGVALWRRPRLLPYLMVGHFLLDLATAMLLLPQ